MTIKNAQYGVDLNGTNILFLSNNAAAQFYINLQRYVMGVNPFQLEVKQGYTGCLLVCLDDVRMIVRASAHVVL